VSRPGANLGHPLSHCIAAGQVGLRGARPGPRRRGTAFPPGPRRDTLVAHKARPDNQGETVKARMSNPAQVIPDAMKPLQALLRATKRGGVPDSTLELVHLRVSQVNGCSSCVDSGARTAKKNGETDERLFALAAWRDAPYFTDAERAALALSEAATRLSDRTDPVPDEVWDEAARHHDEKQLAAIILMVATTNLFNRLNATTRQVAGAW
jgi:AhpD family alkylhydroperoxidase